MKRSTPVVTTLVMLAACAIATAQTTTQATTQPIAVIGETVYTMAGEPLKNATVLVRDGKIAQVGANVQIPAGVQTLRAKVVTPGLIDAHTVVGLQGYRNEPREQDQ